MLYRAEMHILAGRRREAEQELRDARAALGATGVPQYAYPFATIEAQIALLAGDPDRASEIVQRVLETNVVRRHKSLRVAGDVARREDRGRSWSRRVGRRTDAAPHCTSLPSS